MVKKFNKNQIYIILGTIVTFLMIFCIILFINESNNDDNNINNTTDYKSNYVNANNETTINTTSKKDETTIKETETTTEIITTQESTTPIPTQPQTEATKPIETQTENIIKPTESTTQIQYRDPYTGQVISKEEYESIMDEVNNPRQENTTTSAPKENVYVLNDDGTLNFKESKLYNYGNNSNEQSEFLRMLYESKEVKELVGENLYPYITMYTASWNSLFSSRPTFFVCINDEYWLVMTFDENWNIKKGTGDGIVSLYDPKNLPIKEDW